VSIYNHLLVTLRCPRCGRQSEVDTKFRFGLRDLTTYRLGGTLVWEGKGVRTPTHRPTGGDLDEDGYAVCPHCENDFWVRISVRNDVIVCAEVDATRRGYIRQGLATRP